MTRAVVPTLDDTALNRATLARQLLLDRQRVPVDAALHRVGGLNAQNAIDPYIGLWARIDGFRPEHLVDTLHDRSVVRACLMRYTQHLVTADDYRGARPVLAPVLERVQRTMFGRRTAGVDPAELVGLGTSLLRGRTLTRPELGRLLAERWPEHEPGALAWSFQYLAPVVHPPPDALWGRRGGRTPFALAEDWLGSAPPRRADPAALVLWYLAAFGPATVRDAQAWSGLTRLSEVFDTLRTRLATFSSAEGAELFDLPDAPRPAPDAPAPLRFLPAFDNLLLAHANRARIMSRETQSRVCEGSVVAATVLINRTVAATWRIRHEGAGAALIVEAAASLDATTCCEIEAEGAHLLAFAAPDATRHRVELR